MHIRYIFFLLIIVGLIAELLSGCVKNNSDCLPQEDVPQQGVQINFYSRTPCQSEADYPAEIDELIFGIFDKEGILVYHTTVSNVSLNEEYFRQVELNSGLYTVIAWSGADEDIYELSELQDSITTRNDLFLRLKRTDNIAYSIEERKLFYGESAAIYVAEGTETNPVWEYVKVNMQELTNRLTILAEGLNIFNEYEIVIESDNSEYNQDGSIRPGSVVEYVAEATIEEGVITANVTVLKLQTGYTNTIIIRNTTLDTELYRGSLLGTLLLKNPDVNLDCDHDFVIRFTAEDQCACGTYAITEIWVNNWLVHSYDTPM